MEKYMKTDVSVMSDGRIVIEAWMLKSYRDSDGVATLNTLWMKFIVDINSKTLEQCSPKHPTLGTLRPASFHLDDRWMRPLLNRLARKRIPRGEVKNWHTLHFKLQQSLRELADSVLLTSEL